jgi:hypothetical protein
MFVASAIFSDKMIVCDEHFPIVSYREGSENRYFAAFREWLR